MKKLFNVEISSFNSTIFNIAIYKIYIIKNKLLSFIYKRNIIDYIEKLNKKTDSLSVSSFSSLDVLDAHIRYFR